MQGIGNNPIGGNPNIGQTQGHDESLKKPTAETKAQVLSNGHTISILNEKGKFDLGKVSSYFFNFAELAKKEGESGIKGFKDLTKLETALQERLTKLETKPKGIIEFFKSLFSRSSKAEEKHLIEEFISGIRAAKDEITLKNMAMPKGETVKQPPAKQPPLSGDTQPTSVAVDENPNAKLSPQVPPQPEAKPAVDEGLKMAPPPPPPPPPPGMGPPPPPAPGMSAPVQPKELTSEEKLALEKQKHAKAEENKLQRALKDRSNAITFFDQKRPQNEKELEKTKQFLEESISNYNKLRTKENSTTIDGLIAKSQKELDSVEEQLKGTLKPVASSRFDAGTKRLELEADFAKKLEKLTNNEIKFILGQLFDGQVPTAEHAHYKTYMDNKEKFDNIFGEWSELSNSKSGKAFAEHAEDWKKAAGAQTKGFLIGLERRQTGELKEPNYQPKSYEQAQAEKKLQAEKMKNKKPVVPQQEVGGGGDMGAVFDAIKNNPQGMLKKPKADLPPKPEEKKTGMAAVFDEINKRRIE